MDPPSAFGKFSAFAVETRLQIWRELLCEPVSVLTPLWFLRARNGLYCYKRPEPTPFDVAIFRSSKACGLEAMEVFYAAEHSFSFCALPSQWELECMNSHQSELAVQFAKSFGAWTPLYPTTFAARYIKHIQISISVAKSRDCFGGYQVSDYSLCMALMRKLQRSADVRKTCFIELLFLCGGKPEQGIQVLGASFFRGMKTLTAFEQVTINCSGSPSLAYFALNPDKPRPQYLDSYKNLPLRWYIMRRIMEELEHALGRAIVLDNASTHIVKFRPRSHLAGSELKSEKYVDGLKDEVQAPKTG